MKYILSILLLLTSLNASEIAFAKSVKGDVTVKSGDKTSNIKSGSTLDSGMILITKEKSSITIIFKDGSNLVLGPNSMIKLEKFLFKPIEKEYEFELFLEKGSVAFESGKIGDLSPEDFILKTPDGTVAIRGTKFAVKVQ
ncbi:FecR domain-containing protein [Sulfurimonas sp.]|uniref:FecR family protein n=1 Tax=Sulfurimonas sp. TaxID=2022749 RepID=UPI003562408B